VENNIDPQYVKSLEKLVETFQGKFEEMTFELERINDMYWKELDNIIPIVSKPVAACLDVKAQAKALAKCGATVALSIIAKDYDIHKGDDIITSPCDIMKELYSKPPSATWDSTYSHPNKKYEAEHSRTLYTSLLKMSNDINRNTNRVCGDTVILPMEVVGHLTRLEQFDWDTGKASKFHTLRKIGKIGRFTVIGDLFDEGNICVVLHRGPAHNYMDGAGCIAYSSGLHHWFRPEGYEKHWETLKVT
jgi:hypothetical protein